MKISVSKEKIGCPCRRGHDFRILRSNFSAKTKNFAKAFLPVHMGARSNLLSKKTSLKKFQYQTLRSNIFSFLTGGRVCCRQEVTPECTKCHLARPAAQGGLRSKHTSLYLSLSLSFSLSRADSVPYTFAFHLPST